MQKKRYAIYFLSAAAALLLTHPLAHAAPAGSGGPESIVLNGPDGDPLPYSIFEPEREIRIPAGYRRKQGEFRGLWIATAWNLDFPVSGSPDAFRKQFDSLVRKAADAGFNALIFQIRPMNDAFYPSRFNPVSRYLTGKEGTSWEGNFDPLAHMIRSAHAAGLEFHAWINPYRVATNVQGPASECLNSLSPDNFARKRPELVLSSAPAKNGGCTLFLNPGEPEVLLFIVSTVREILENYEVDAIHMDDYFYPYEDVGEADLATYRKYGTKSGFSLEDWRRDNINRMVRTVSTLIRTSKRKRPDKSGPVRFGISPFGIWANLTPPKPISPEAVKYWRKQQSSPLGSPTKGDQSLFRLYADSRKWVGERWIDYIAPQIYWGFSCREAPYAAVVDWWADTVSGTGVDLYVGIGLARMGVVPHCSDPAELPNQLRFNSACGPVKGCVFYSCRNFLDPNPVLKKGLKTVIESFWHGKMP